MTVVARRNMICRLCGNVCGVFMHCRWTCTCDPLCACSFVWHLSMFSQLRPGTCSFIRSSLASIFFLNGDFLLEIEVSLLCIQTERERDFWFFFFFQLHLSVIKICSIHKQPVKPGIIHTYREPSSLPQVVSAPLVQFPKLGLHQMF